MFARTLTLLVLVAASCAPGAPRRNVLFLLSDQHNARALGCYGSERVRTPSIDRLAAEGTRFANAFCNTPQCAPSRFTIWTGRYSKSHGMRANRVPESLEEITVAEVLGDLGWRTATIGKHHMTRSPTEHGFETVVDLDAFEAWRTANDVEHWNRAGSWYEFAKGVVPGKVGTSRVPNEQQRDGWFATKALEFLREDDGRPFCLWLSFYGPHTPIVPHEDFARAYSPESAELPPTVASAEPQGHAMLDHGREVYASFGIDEHRKMTASYQAFVTQMDHNVGRVLDELDALGIADETIVVYASDHGDMAGSQGIWGKYYFLYDEVLRVPLVVRAPGIPAGVVRDELVGLIDVAPTLLELAGAEIPDAMQGRSFVSLAQGGVTDWRTELFAETGYSGSEWGRSVAVRSLTHKLVRIDHSGVRTEQLFELESDPWETANRIYEPEVAAIEGELRAKLEAWDRETETAALVLPTER